MLSDLEHLLDYVRQRAADLPVCKRIRILRAMAEICGDPGEEKQLREQADAFERAEELCREFKFSFDKKSSGDES